MSQVQKISKEIQNKLQKESLLKDINTAKIIKI